MRGETELRFGWPVGDRVIRVVEDFLGPTGPVSVMRVFP